MKYYQLIIAAAFVSACNTTPKLHLTLKAPGIQSGKLMLRQFNETVLTQNIKDGTGRIDQALASPGYYEVTVTDDSKSLSDKKTFTLYLENGNYSVEPQGDIYPNVTTDSRTQQQLTDYYLLEQKMAGKLDHTIDSLVKYIDSREAKALPAKQRSALFAKTRGYQTERRKLEPKILTDYLTAHPESIAAAHILAEQYLDEYAKDYAAVYAKLSQAAKNTDDGIKVGNKVSVLIRLMPGATAADVAGKTPDGQDFDRNSLKGKVVLVEFWKSGSEVVDRNHAKMSNGLIFTESDRRNFATVSISLDADKATWLKNALKTNASWIQVSDLKGDASPNVSNWKVKAVPTYFLLDENWHLLKADIDLLDVDQAVHDHLSKK